MQDDDFENEGSDPDIEAAYRDELKKRRLEKAREKARQQVQREKRHDSLERIKEATGIYGGKELLESVLGLGLVLLILIEIVSCVRK